MEETSRVKTDPHSRHVIVWKILRPLVRLIVWLRLGFHSDVSRVSGPFLLVSNHVTDWDPLLVGAGLREQAYFVASEHVVRSKPFGKLIAWLLDPIPRQKGAGAAGTVLTMMRRLRRGENVAVFPEGNRCWDGVTQPMLPSIGKLARSSGVKLVTYRLEGGYFTSPRWAGARLRRGRMHGGVVRVYSPEELKAMSVEAINAAIAADLHEDAYARQRREPVRFRGARLAEHLDRLLFICPKCGKRNTLSSRGDTLSCSACGMRVKYLSTGFLEGDGLPFDTVRDLSRLQDEQILALCRDAKDNTPIFTDSDMRTEEVDFARGVRSVARGEIALYSDRLEIPGVTIPLEELTGLALVGAQDLYVGADGVSYLVRSDYVRCLYKYLAACRALRPEADFGL